MLKILRSLYLYEIIFSVILIFIITLLTRFVTLEYSRFGYPAKVEGALVEQIDEVGRYEQTSR